MILTLFLVSLRLNIKLRYLFLYLLSVSLYKWKSSLSVFLATSEALSTETFKSDSFNLKCREHQVWGKWMPVKLAIKKRASNVISIWIYIRFFHRILASARGFLSKNHAHSVWLPPQTQVSLKLKLEAYFLSHVSDEFLWTHNDSMCWGGIWLIRLENCFETELWCNNGIQTKNDMENVFNFSCNIVALQ